MKKIILLFGPPGSGKGTQAQLLAKKIKLPAISTGELLRLEIKKQTVIGKKAARLMAAGALVGDRIVDQLLAKRIRKPDCQKGFILDGYPRDHTQMDFLLSLAGKKDLLQPLELRVSDSEVKKRMKLRARLDDTAATIAKRLRDYHKSIEPILNSVRAGDLAPLIKVDGEQTIAAVQTSVIEALKRKASGLTKSL